MAKPKPDGKPTRKLRGRIQKALKIAAAVILLLMAVGIIWFITLINQTDWKDFDPGKLENQAQTLIFYDKDGNAVGGLYGGQNRTNIPLSDVPKHVRNALLAAEDIRFYSHPGVDIQGILAAAWADITKGKMRGASTLSQQLMKITHLTNEQTLTRKLQDARLALELERAYTKDEIMEMYLNTMYFGNGAYGIEAAAQSYFSKPAKELTLAEGALIIGILKGPGIYAPHLNLEKSTQRRNLILGLMNEYGLITKDEMEKAKEEKVTLKLQKRNNANYGFYIDAAENEAMALTGITREDLVSGGYRIYTSMDPALQKKCDELMSNPDLYPANAKDGTEVQGALVVLDSKTGAARAVVGGREYTTRQGLNRAVSSKRQPGSAIKPMLVYSPAIDRFGYNPATMIQDAPVDFNGYKPVNAGGKYSGWVTLRQAIVRSINVPAVRVLNDIGISSAKDFASSAGITFDPGDDSLAIGLGGFTRGVTPIELASAYTALANSGNVSKASFVQKIVDSDGVVIYENSYPTKPVMSDSTAFIMTDILHNAAMSGTAKLLNFNKIPLAAKTGTVAWDYGNKDVWLASYNPDYVVVCWMGFDRTDKDHYLSTGVIGGTNPAQMCKEVYTYLYSQTAAPKFRMPDSVTLLALDRLALEQTGQILLASPLTPEDQKLYDYFPKSQAPTEVSQYWQTPVTPTGFNVVLSERGYPLVSFLMVQDFARYDVYRINEYGRTEKVTEIQGAAGSIATYEDTSVLPGSYTYYVSPVHPQLNVAGNPTIGINISVAVSNQPTEQPGSTSPWDDIFGGLFSPKNTETPPTAPPVPEATAAAP